MMKRDKKAEGVIFFLLWLSIIISASLFIANNNDAYLSKIYFSSLGACVFLLLLLILILNKKTTSSLDQLERNKNFLFLDSKCVALLDTQLKCHGFFTRTNSDHYDGRFFCDFFKNIEISAESYDIIKDFLSYADIASESMAYYIHLDDLYIHQNELMNEIVVHRSYEHMHIIKVRYAAVQNSKMLQKLPIGYFEIDESGVIVKANRHFCSYLRYDRVEEIIGAKLKIFDIIVSSSSNEIDAEMHKSFHQEIVSIKTSNGFIETFLLVISPNNLSINTIGFLMRLRQKEIDYFSTHLEKYWIDYSWKCFFDTSPYPVCIVDTYGKIHKANNAFISSVPHASFDVNFTDIFQQADELKERMLLIASGENVGQTMQYVKSIDQNRIYEIFLGKILDLEGKFYAFMVRVTDVTQKKHIEENLSHSQRMQTIGQLTGSIAHDFNNILTAISGFSDLLLLNHGVEDPSFSSIMQIKQSAQRASLLIQRLMAFSRKQNLHMQCINPIDLFSEFSPIIYRLVGTQVQFNLDISSDCWDIYIDIVQMEQVILNLVVNAQQAIKKDGIISIKVENIEIFDDAIAEYHAFHLPPGEKLPSCGKYVMITVIDNGAGIQDDKIPHIFEPFYTTKSHISGTGLGLSTVYGVVKQLGGFIILKSTLNIGTEFKIFLPRINDKIKEKHNIIASEEQVEYSLPGNETIVFIEDEDAIRVFAKNVLVLKGYKVIDFSSPDIALEHLMTHDVKFHLIITDVVMPEMSGPKLVSRLKEKYANCKILFISGYVKDAFSEEYGQNDVGLNFLQKPFSLKQLTTKVQELLAQK